MHQQEVCATLKKKLLKTSKRHAKTILVAQIWMMVFFGMFHGGAILLSLENILKTVLKNTKSIFLKLQKKICKY